MEGQCRKTENEVARSSEAQRTREAISTWGSNLDVTTSEYDWEVGGGGRTTRHGGGERGTGAEGVGKHKNVKSSFQSGGMSEPATSQAWVRQGIFRTGCDLKHELKMPREANRGGL